MKKKFFFIFLFAAIAIAAGWNVVQNEKGTVNLSDLALDNIEALAQTETSDEFEQNTGCRAVLENKSCSGKDGNIHSYAEKI